jgi:hypothetical protein
MGTSPNKMQASKISKSHWSSSSWWLSMKVWIGRLPTPFRNRFDHNMHHPCNMIPFHMLQCARGLTTANPVEVDPEWDSGHILGSARLMSFDSTLFSVCPKNCSLPGCHWGLQTLENQS